MRALMEALSRDLRSAFRAFRRSPAFTLSATMVLALGIGSSVVVFSMLDTLVLRPLALREPDRLFAIGTQPPPDAQWLMQTVRVSVVDEWQAEAKSFEGIAAFLSPSLTWEGPDGPERITGGALVGGDLFGVLGAPMTIGRPFTLAEADTAPAILSHTFWRQRFGARPDVIGQTIELDGVAYTIVGVLLPETGLPVLGAQRLVWIPRSPAGLPRDRTFANVVGRLQPGVERDAATAELAAIQRNVEDERGFTPKARGVVLQSMRENRTALVGPTLAALFGGSLVLLIIACANVGTLSLTRQMERRHDMAVRCSLGASRWNLERQVIVEHLVLWSIGGVLGLLLGAAGLRWVMRANPLPPTQVPENAIAIDIRAVLFTVVITFGTALVFGLLTARQSSRINPVSTLREDGTAVSASRTARAWRQGLVVSQVALSTVLASGACLLALSFFNLTAQPLGFVPDDLLTFRVQLPPRDYPDQPSRLQFQRALVTSLEGLPGVEAAATTSAIPLGTIGVGPIAIQGLEPTGEPPWAGVQAVDTNYLATARIRVVAGRGLEQSDRTGGDPVAVVNQTFARSYFPGQEVLGRQLSLTAAAGSQSWLRIVGVVEDVKHAGLDFDYLPEIFVPYDQVPNGPLGGLLGAEMFATLRVPSALRPTEGVLRQLLAGLDPNLPLMELRTGQEIVAASAKSAQFRTTIMGGVAVLAVVLSGMGLFAVLRQTVAQRRKEFGIRLAIGATPLALLWAACRSGVGLAVVGIVAGTISALALAQYVRSLLYGVSAIEPRVLAGVAVVMLVVALSAAALPAWWTSRLSPTLAIRNR